MNHSFFLCYLFGHSASKEIIISDTFLKQGSILFFFWLCNIMTYQTVIHNNCAANSVFNFVSWSTESPVMLHRVLVCTLTHVMHTRVPDGEALFHDVVHEVNA